MLNATQLAALQTPTISALPDAQAAAALPASPRTAAITFVSLGGSTVWGLAAAAAFQQALTTLGQQPPGAAIPGTSPPIDLPTLARTLVSALSGGGISPTDPQITAFVEVLVEAGLITQAQATEALYVQPQTADVTTARAMLARQAGTATLSRLRTQVANGQAAAAALLSQAQSSLASAPTTATLPTAAQLVAAFTTQVTG